MKKSKVILMFVAITSVLAFGLISCKKDEPVQPHVTSVQLTVEDVSCTEAWLKVSLTDPSEPRTVAVQQNGQRVLTAHMLGSDSVFVVEGLLPRQAYSFVAQRLRDTTAIDVSSHVQATTMDTTSHNFHFEIDTLGVTSSTLYDVAIINDTLAYAVGEMHLRDSTGQLDPLLYNVAVWNGNHWNILRLNYGGYPAPITFIFAFDMNDIWFGMGYLIHWDGAAYRQVEVPVFYGIRSNKMWGSTSGELYVVGDNGTIAYSSNHGSTWQRMESVTTLPLTDVLGARYLTTNTTEILALSSNANSSTGSKVLSIENTSARQLPSLGLSWGLDGIWFVPGRQYVVVGDGLWRTHSKESSWVQDRTLAPLHKTCIDGTGCNDIVVGGAFWYLIHYNGVSWRSYYPFASGSFTAVAMRNNLIIAVGGIGGRAIAVRGTR